MRGRQIFNLFHPAIIFISLIFFLVPKFIIGWLWIIADFFPGIIGNGIRYVLALRLAKKIGRNVYFGRGIEVRSWNEIVIGNNVSIHKDCYIDAFGGLSIGDDVSIAHNCSIITFDHSWLNIKKPIRSNPISVGAVIIDSDVWIGCGCRILSGVQIGSRSIVAAGAVVTKSIGPGLMVGGVPCKTIKVIMI